MRFYELDKIMQDLFYFKDFDDITEQIEALEYDKRFLSDAKDRFPESIELNKDTNEFSVSASDIVSLDSILIGLKSISIQENLESLSKFDKLSYRDVLIILTILLGKINFTNLCVSKNLLFL